MTELTTRAYVETDAAAVAGLMNIIEGFDGAEPFFSEADIRSEMSAWLKDPLRDSRLLFAPDGTLVAVGSVAAPPPGGVLSNTFGGVHPDWRGRAIGRELYAWQLTRIAEMHQEQAPEVDWAVHSGTNVNDAPGRKLYARFGLTPVRYFSEMLAPTTGVPAAAVSEGLRIEPYADEMLTAVYEAHNAAFADHWGHERTPKDDWTLENVGSETFRADLSRIAFDGADIAGYVLAYNGMDNKLYIGQVGTARAWRKRGVASALISAVLTAGAADGKALALLGVDADSPTGAVGVYERLGFAMTTQFVVYQQAI